MKKCVILNPSAGSVGDARAVTRQIKQLSRARIRITSRRGDAARFAKESLRQGFDYIIAAGGDGTLNEVVNGIALHSAKVTLGLLPLGTGNDFARTLNLPSGIDANLDILRAARTKPIDLVRAQSDRVRYFVNVSAGGFSGLVNEKLTPRIKRIWGPLAYVRSAAAALPELHAYRTTVSLDQKKRLSLDLYNVIIANGRFVAGGLPVAPEANPADGLLDVILIRKRPMSEMALLVAKILLGKHSADDGIVVERTTEVSVKSRPGMWFNADGELVSNEPAVFHLLPGALQFVVGSK